METLGRIEKKYSDRLIKVWFEDDDGRTYWAYLKKGWISNLECRTVHERTLNEFESEIKCSKKIK